MCKLKNVALITLLALAGCTSLAPGYQRPDMPVPNSFSASRNALVESTGMEDTGWRSFFLSPQLKQVIALSLTHNQDLRTASLKVAEAAAQYSLIDAERYPQLNGSSNATYSGGFDSQSTTTHQYSVGMALSFELDFFGRLKNMSEAEQQRFFASQQAQRAVHILVVSNVAQSYMNRSRTEAQLNIANQALLNYQRSYRFIEQRTRVGNSTLLALEQARGQIETARSDIAKRRGELSQANNALQLVVGQYSLPAEPVTSAAQPVSMVTLPANLSSDILLQRPDIVEAERLLMAGNANIGAARAAFFPSISLTGSATGSSTDLSSLFDSASGLWNFIPKISIPIFDGGKNRANLSLAEIRQQMSVVTYEQKIQNAFKQVADALSLRDSIAQRIEAQRRYLNSLQTTLRRANVLYDNGAISYLEILDTERTLFSARQTLTDLKYDQQINEINLFTALGGGWVE
ncbi:Cu(I)/Ag(I) efflux RND transporter outer membrane protein [Budvicia diplopodorum]|uniref:Cu(I)/Ag(I) efflux RND transporter outer membrane protein n=1 Tax=Budvicia diplopodorum TaxID=1119056 RepID=UPI00135C9E8B|nr:Cu(I)/Ag(I) efflux RND transporter outer membrane protein [Budvicia diplopodorum]